MGYIKYPIIIKEPSKIFYNRTGNSLVHKIHIIHS